MRTIGTLLLVACSLHCHWLAAQVNLITNPSFEQVDEKSGFPASWAPTYWSNPHGKITVSTEARTGERGVKIEGVPPEKITDPTPRNNNLIVQKIDPPIKGVRKLKLEFWFKAAANAKAFCSIMTHDAQGKRLQYISSTGHRGVTEWTQLILAISTARETAQLTVFLRNDGEGPVWVDDVSLTAADDVLESDLLRAHVEPLVGGRVCSVIVKRRDRDATIWEGVRPGGLAADIVPGDDYPGLLRDSACKVEVVEKGRRVRVTHGPLPEPYDGLVIEKELVLRGALPVIDVKVRVRNQAAQARSIALRAQQCLPPRQTTITVPMAGQLRVLRHEEGLVKWEVNINDLDASWIACADATSNDTVLFTFDRDDVTKAYLYRNQDLQTAEWYYRKVTIAPGSAWETDYALAVLHSGSPVVAVSRDVAVGLSPLSTDGDAARTLTVCALSSAATAQVAVAGVERKVSLSPGDPAVVGLPQQGKQVKSTTVNVQAGSSTAGATISPMSLDASPLMDLPPPPERLAEFPAATSFFPYGEYFRGYVKGAAGNMDDHIRRQLRAYRRCYMNTYMSSDGGMLGQFRRNGVVPLLEEVRKRRMRVIPRGDMMRRFERDANRRILRELPPEPATREAILARLERGGATLDLRRRFVKAYGDLILAYDYADEPRSQHIPNYMVLQSVYREVDPDHPVLVILNLNRTEYLPFMPIYYGDEYPVRNPKRGGRDPWAVTKMVRFCATHTKAPVWVMLQAFGGLPEYTWQLPDEAEMRLTIYEAIANGCKGLTFHGSSSPPCWRYNLYYFDTARDSWGVEAPAWTAMRDAGRHITAIGPALLTTDVSDVEVLRVECEAMTDEAVPYRGPAIKVGVLRQRGAEGWFAVVVNQDVKRLRRGTLSLNADVAPRDSRLYGLYDLEQSFTAAHPVELAPGDGRIFFVGAEAAATPVLAAVHKGHYDNELPLYEMDLEVAVANGCDTTHAAELAAEAAKDYRAEQFARAHEKIVVARKVLDEAVSANTVLADAQRGLSEAQAMLSEVVLTYRRHFDVVVPPDVRKQFSRGAMWKNDRDHKLQGYADDTAKALCLRMKLEDRVCAGKAAQVLPRIIRLRQTAVRLKEEAIPYVRSR